MLNLRRKLMAAALLLAAPALLSAPSALVAQTKAAKSKPAAAASATNKLDINTATADQLKAFPGIGDAYSARIIAGRPYTKKDQLVSKGVLPQGVYNKIKDQIIATQPKK